MGKKCLTAILVVLFMVVSFGSANATITHLGDVLQDSDTGLEWLDMSLSVGVSPDSIIEGSDPSGLASQGWVHASLAQISTLFINAGIAEPFDGGQSPLNFEGPNLLISLLGAMGSFGDSVSIQAFAGEGPSLGLLYTPVVMTSFGTHGGVDFPEWAVPSSMENPTIGNWLVRSISVSEPNIDAILAFFDESIIDGSLTGYGQGSSADGRLNALGNMLEMAGDLINIDDIEGACDQLGSALGKCDDDPLQADFVVGSAVLELYDMITELMTELGCE